jgi:fructokinase
LGQRAAPAASTIQQLLDATPRTAWKLLDLNLRPPFYDESVIRRSLDTANALKLNDGELRLLGDILALPSDPRSAVAAIRQRFELRLVALTRGAEGSTIWLDTEESDIGPRNLQGIVDTVGAGDSFTAALVSGLLHHVPLKQVHEVAAQVAAYVCTQPGAVPVLPAELLCWTPTT